MGKKYRLILVVLIAVLLVATLAACNTGEGQIGRPDKDPGPEIPSVDTSKTPIALAVRSAQGTYFLGEFTIEEDFYYYVTYSRDGVSYIDKSEKKNLSEDMLSADDRLLLTQAGSHSIKVTDTIEGKTLSGNLEITLRERADTNKYTLSVDLDGGQIASTAAEVEGGVAKILLSSGTTYSYIQFISKFPVYKNGYALAGFEVTAGADIDGVWDASSAAKLAVNSDISIKALWTTNIVNVGFDLNLPSDVSDGEADGITAPAAQNVEKDKGLVAKPDAAAINKLNNYEFAGWTTDKAGSSLYNFGLRVGSEDFTLYAQWREKKYSLDLYTMGGIFDLDGYADIDVAGLTKAEVYSEYSNGSVFKLSVSGLVAGSSYENYYIELSLGNPSAGDAVVLKNVKLTDLIKVVEKTGGVYVPEKQEGKTDGWYTDASDENSGVMLSGAVGGNLKLYVHWTPTADGDLNEYYVNHLFKDGLTVKQDGTLRIDKLTDYTVNGIELPASIEIDGVARNITEIGERAFRNSSVLLSVDMSKAVHLTAIGKEAFAYSAMLKTITFPNSATEGGSGNKIETIGQDAFLGTAWFNNYEQSGEKLLQQNGIAVKYFGADEEYAIPDGIVAIAAGCFADNGYIKKVTVPSSVKRIEDFAFAEAVNFADLSVVSGGNIEYVGSEAFNDTPYVKDAQSSIIIGNLYYRYVGKGRVETIPDTVNAIAPRAFINGKNITSIIFKNEGKINSVGENAFTATEWAKDKGFVIVNNMLAEYMNGGTSADIPDSVTRIITGAFGEYAKRLTSVTIPSGVNAIDADAFSGAAALANISFEARSTLPKTVAANSFPKDANLWFETDIYSKLTEADGVWYSIYQNNKDKFGLRHVISVEFDESVMPDKFLQKDNTPVDVKATLKAMFPDGLNAINLYYSNGGADKNTPLDYDKLKAENGSYTYNYDKDGLISDTLDYKIIRGIDNALIYDGDDEGSTVIVGNDETAPLRIEGLSENYYTTTEKIDYSNVFAVGTVNGEEYKIRITEAMADAVSGNLFLMPGEKSLYFTVNYENIATYRIRWNFTVTVAKIASVEQNGIFKLPIGADSAAFNKSMEFLVTYEDGDVYRRPIGHQNVTIIGIYVDNTNTVKPVTANKLDTSYPGYRKARVQYVNNSDESREDVVTVDFYYVVTFDASGQNLVFETDDTTNEATLTRVPVVGDAAKMIIVPSVYEKNGKEYTVTAIGDEAFRGLEAGGKADNKVVERVYLPSTVTEIGEKAFMGCSNLKFVGSFVDFNADTGHHDDELHMHPVTVDDNALKIVREKVSGEVTVDIVGTTDASVGHKTIVVPFPDEKIAYSDTITKTKTVGGVEYTYPCERDYTVSFAQLSEEDVRGAFHSFIRMGGTVYLPATDAYKEFVQTKPSGYAIYERGEQEISDVSWFQINVDIALEANKNGIVFDRECVVASTADVPDFKINTYAGEEETEHNGIYMLNRKNKAENQTTSEESEYTINATLVGFEDGALDKLLASDKCSAVFLPDDFTEIGAYSAAAHDKIMVYNTDTYPELVRVPVEFAPSSVKTIGARAFENCTSLTEFKLSVNSNLSEIGSYAFSNSGLVSIDLSAAKLVDNIGTNIFQNCSNLKSVVLPVTLTLITNQMFNECRVLESVTAANADGSTADFTNIAYVGSYAFRLCGDNLNVSKESFANASFGTEAFGVAGK